MSWTDRYLAAVLRSIPEDKRADVERELRSSITDAIEERVGAGEDAVAAERSVLEGLGDPSKLAAGYTGRPNHLIGPELFPLYRFIVPRLIAAAMPIAGVILAAVELLRGGDYGDAIGAGISGAITVAIQIAFWATLTFVVLERADAAREAREEIVAKTGTWRLEYLPERAPGRVTAGEAFGEVISVLLTIGGLFLLRGTSVSSGAGPEIPLAGPELTLFWFPVLLAVLVGLAVLQFVVYIAGRWTMTLAAVFAALELAFAVPMVWLALTGQLINPTFAEHIGYPGLVEGDGVVMLAIAVGATLVTAWEIVSAFLRARGARPLASIFRMSGRSA